MAVVKMRKLQLVAMSYDKDALLNAMQQTGAVEILLKEEDGQAPPLDAGVLTGYFARVETALDCLCNAVAKMQKENKEEIEGLEDGFHVSYSEFFDVQSKKSEIDETVERVHLLLDAKNTLLTEKSKLTREIERVIPYADIQIPFSFFSDTANTKSRLGVIPAQTREQLETSLNEIQLCDYTKWYEDAELTLFHVVCHKSVAKEINERLSSFGFIDGAFDKDKKGIEVYQELKEQEKSLNSRILENEATMYTLKDRIRGLKVYCDYLKFTLEKADISQKLEETERTFLLQAYVPEEAESAVKQAIQEVSKAAYVEFFDPTEEDAPPTLLRNNAIVSNFESITNTFSVPNYREFDPNAIMSFFYSLFMGFIIGDAGYGFLMAAIGGWLWWSKRKKPSGTSKLAGAFAVGGLFAILWGALFNSFFGFMVLPMTVMPNPQTDMWKLVGISVPSVLIISMELGIFQLFVGYICKAVQEWRRGNIIDGICDGVIWAAFSVGVALAIVGFIDEAKLPMLATVGGVMAIGSLLLAMLTAGRKEKFFGKFTKGFGAVYGIINYASDVLSYARLYGLMLSGAVIAGIIAQYAGGFVTSGNIALIILGVLLLVVGHGFNLVMNLLGAYIHDSRLQYVEFFGRFYEGDGEEFTPLGSKNKYVSLTHK